VAGLDQAIQQACVRAPMSLMARQTPRHWVGASEAAHGEDSTI